MDHLVISRLESVYDGVEVVERLNLSDSRSAICWSVGHGIARRYGKSRPAVLSRRVGGGHPPLLLQQIPDLEHSFHAPASLGES